MLEFILLILSILSKPARSNIWFSPCLRGDFLLLPTFLMHTPGIQVNETFWISEDP